MLKIFLILLTTAYAAPTPWWCTLRAQVSGNPKHYLLYGRDAWEGGSILRCRRGIEEKIHPAYIGFFSGSAGFGANASSILTFRINLWTYLEPLNSNFDVTGPGLVDGSVVYWHLVPQPGMDLSGSVWTHSDRGAARSLSFGTLSLRVAR